MIVLDIETNLIPATVIWVAVTEDVDTGPCGGALYSKETGRMVDVDPTQVNAMNELEVL